MTSVLTATDSSPVHTSNLGDEKHTEDFERSPSAVLDTSHEQQDHTINSTPPDSCGTLTARNELKHISTCVSKEEDMDINAITNIADIKALKIQDDDRPGERNSQADNFHRTRAPGSSSEQRKETPTTGRLDKNISSTDSKGKSASASASAQRTKSDQSLFQKILSLSSRTRDLLPSPRQPKYTYQIVFSPNGSSNLQNLSSIHALAHASSDRGTDGKRSCSHCCNCSANSHALNDKNTEHPIIEPRRAIRAERDNKNHRGRSLFRAQDHKRSSAPSLSKDRPGESLKLRPVRRELPSPEPAKNKHWQRNLRTWTQTQKNNDEKHKN